MTITLLTPAATLEVAASLDDCLICHAPSPDEPGGPDLGSNLTIDVRHPDHTDELVICGQCLARGLAIAFGSAHMAAGGSIGDLTYNDER